jgi:hypothetical protein
MTEEGSWRQVGNRVQVVSMEHSPATTREAGQRLIGQTGCVAALIRNGIYALVELDVLETDLPRGVRRWSVHWDDLTSYPAWPNEVEPSRTYRMGLSGVGRGAVQHASQDDKETGLCGQTVYPLPFSGWSISFNPSSARACPTCAQLTGSPVRPTGQETPTRTSEPREVFSAAEASPRAEMRSPTSSSLTPHAQISPKEGEYQQIK